LRDGARTWSSCVVVARYRTAFSLLIAASACGAPASEESHGTPVTYDGKNRVLRFDGAADYATTGTAAFPFPTEPQTVALWVRLADAPPPAGDSGTANGMQTLISLRKDFDSGFMLGLRDGAFEVSSVYTGRTYVRAAMPAKKSVWQYLAYTFERSVHRLYVDGQPVGEGDTEPSNRTPTTVWLGSVNGSSAFFAGDVDEVRVHTAALSSSTIAAQAERGRARDASIEQPDALVLWLGFDEVSGFRALDRSARGNEALLGDGIAAHSPERLIEDP
jgi:hypothetical protein